LSVVTNHETGTLQQYGPSPNAIELEFETVREGWNIYAVKDVANVTLKVKLVLMRLFLNDFDPAGNPNFGAFANLVFAVSIPSDVPELRGPKSTRIYSSEEIAQSIVAKDLPFDPIKEEWNDYKLAEGMNLGARAIVTSISRTSKFDPNGDAIYYVLHQFVTRGNVTAEAKSKLRNRYDEAMNLRERKDS
jgi:hypothetical protein